MANESNLTDVQRQMFEKIAKNEASEFRALLTQNKGSVNFVDENGMSPLQHACYKGNKEIVQMLLDQVCMRECGVLIVCWLDLVRFGG